MKTRFNVEAKICKMLNAAGSPECSREELSHEQIIRECFGLRYYLTTKIQSALVLSRDSKVPELKLALPKRTLDAGHPICINERESGVFLSIDRCTMSEFAEMLGRVDGSQVADHTGVSGRFHIELHWSNDLNKTSTQTESWPSIYIAVKEQLGLQMQPGCAPFPHVVVDAILPPQPN